jgi:hypothetical protein
MNKIGFFLVACSSSKSLLLQNICYEKYFFAGIRISLLVHIQVGFSTHTHHRGSRAKETPWPSDCNPIANDIISVARERTPPISLRKIYTSDG